MPLYEYQCEKCGDLFEAIQKFSDEPLKVHEKCGGPVRRLLSAPALQFKGTGWYITDYAKSGSSGSSSNSGNGKSSSESSTKTEKSATSSTTSGSSSDTK